MMPKRRQFFQIDKRDKYSRIRADIWLSHTAVVSAGLAAVLALAIAAAVNLPEVRSQAIELALVALQTFVALADRQP